MHSTLAWHRMLRYKDNYTNVALELRTYKEFTLVFVIRLGYQRYFYIGKASICPHL